MFYCDMRPGGVDTRSLFAPYKRRTVGQYLIVQRTDMPHIIAYRAYTIVQRNDDGSLVWHKHIKAGQRLTHDEEQELMLQILKSEIW